MKFRKLQIPIVIDSSNGEKLTAELVNELFELSEIQQIRLSHQRFACFRCKNAVKLYAAKSSDSPHGHLYHFQHPPGVGNECPWKSGHDTKAEIYAGTQEGFLHKRIKLLLKKTLDQLEGWKVIDVDRYFIFSDDRQSRRKPDVHAEYNGESFAFEIQLRSESVETITTRRKFYQDKGWKLIWISAENKEIVTEAFSDDCLEAKQVHKDIAFTNRGNWLVFNEGLSDESLESGFLKLLVYSWIPRVDSGRVEYGWEASVVTIEDLYFDQGQAFYKDFFQLEHEINSELRVQGRKSVLELLGKFYPESWEDFAFQVKRVWPSVKLLEGEDKEWLESVFRESWNRRVLILKHAILRFFRSSDWRKDENDEEWRKLSIRVSRYPFGIYQDANLKVVEKILLILGFKLSEHLNQNRKSHIRACHFFLDGDKYPTFQEYKSLALRAIKDSPLFYQITIDPSILKRGLHNEDEAYRNTDLDEFYRWFVSPPSLF